MKKHLHNYFIPHEGNDYRPHILQRAAMIAMLALVVLTFTAANLQSLLWQTSDWLISTILPGVVVELTNEERADNGAAALRRSSVLDEAARLKAQHMANNEYFAHYSPDGVSPWYWFTQVSYNYAHAGENLAIHFSDSDEVVEAWMDSPSHRANIVDQKFTEIGVGTARGQYQGYDTVYVVQLFGAPAIARPEPVSEVVVAQSTELAEPTPVLAERIAIVEAKEPVETTDLALADTSEPADDTEISVNEPADESSMPDELFSATPTEPVIENVTVEDDSVSIYTVTVATSSGLKPAPPEDIVFEPSASDPTNAIGSLAVRPNTLLMGMYMLIGLFVAMALTASVAIEWRQQRPVQIAYGLGLLIIMNGLFYLHLAVTSGALIA